MRKLVTRTEQEEILRKHFSESQIKWDEWGNAYIGKEVETGENEEPEIEFAEE